MNIRDFLIQLRDDYKYSYDRGLIENPEALNKIRALDQLIAERPYEPGETVEVWTSGEWRSAGFLCLWGDCIVVYIDDDDQSGFRTKEFNNVRPLPKTTRLKPVPEEVMEAAKKSLDPKESFRVQDDKAHIVADWLANPDNWEE